MTVTVRPAREDDRSQITAFNLAMAEETEGKGLDSEVLERGVAAVLADPARGRYLVAESERGVVGSLMLTTEWSDWRNGTFWWIQSVYVIPEARRTGVYRALHTAVVDAAREADGVCGVRLYVERENVSAQRVYARMGMEETSYRLFEVAL